MCQGNEQKPESEVPEVPEDPKDTKETKGAGEASSDPVSAPKESSPEDTRRHWTKEEMDKAKPRSIEVDPPPES